MSVKNVSSKEKDQLGFTLESSDELCQYYPILGKASLIVSEKTITGGFEQSEFEKVLEIISITINLEINHSKDTLIQIPQFSQR